MFKRRNITKLKCFDTTCVCVCVLESKGWGKSRATEYKAAEFIFHWGSLWRKE